VLMHNPAPYCVRVHDRSMRSAEIYDLLRRKHARSQLYKGSRSFIRNSAFSTLESLSTSEGGIGA